MSCRRTDRNPNGQGNLRSNYYFGLHMCFKSGWKDFLKSYVETVVKNEPCDGTYYDWNTALYCNNPLPVGKTSNGNSGAKGLASDVFSPMGHWGLDELLAHLARGHAEDNFPASRLEAAGSNILAFDD